MHVPSKWSLKSVNNRNNYVYGFECIFFPQDSFFSSADMKEEVIRVLTSRLQTQDSVLTDYEKTISQFRDLVKSLQAYGDLCDN